MGSLKPLGIRALTESSGQDMDPSNPESVNEAKEKSTVANQSSSSASSPKRVIKRAIPATILWGHNSVLSPVFVDSEADDNFIQDEFVQLHKIPLELLAKPRRVNALDGRLIAQVTHCTVPLTLIVSDNHRESILLFVIISPLSPLVLSALAAISQSLD